MRASELPGRGGGNSVRVEVEQAFVPPIAQAATLGHPSVSLGWASAFRLIGACARGRVCMCVCVCVCVRERERESAREREREREKERERERESERVVFALRACGYVKLFFWVSADLGVNLRYRFY